MDDRRKKLKLRAWRRGFREMDLFLGAFADAHLETMAEPDLDAFEALLMQADQDVYSWITNQAPAPAQFETPVLALIRAFNPADRILRGEAG
jgi:antitoxin CptB